MGNCVFTNVWVFDGTGTDRFRGEVRVSGDRIVDVIHVSEIDPTTTQDCAGDVVVVDGHNATLMPGMVEAHAHLTFPSSIGRLFSGLDLPAEDHLLVAAYIARVLLDHGFTSAYSAGSRGRRFEVALRNEIDAGFLPGPRLRASSQETSGSRTVGLPGSHDGDHDRSIDSLCAYVEESARTGVDSIKFELSGNDVDGPGGSETVLFDDDEVNAIGEQARKSQVWLSCHSQAAGSIKQAVRSGFRVLYHCTLADNEALDLLEQHKDRVFVAPAPGLPYSRIHEATEFGIGHDQARQMGAFSSLEGMVRVCPELHKRGVRVLPGGDYGFAYNPIGRNARDLQLFVDLFEYSTTDALVAATSLGGELMDYPVGQIRAGYLADILLIDGNPVADISIMQNPHRITTIMKSGTFHKTPQPAQ